MFDLDTFDDWRMPEKRKERPLLAALLAIVVTCGMVRSLA
jgi:hypothetical protein